MKMAEQQKAEAIPIMQHECQAVRHIEDLGAEVDELRRELRACERHHAEDCRRLWFKIGGVMAALAAVLPTGWAAVLGLI